VNSTSRGPSRWLAVALALALPAGVFFSADRVLQRMARGVPVEVQKIDWELQQTSPQVVVLGSSLANRDIDVPALGRALKVDPERISVLHLPHASMAHWAVLLNQRVYAAGHRPDTVIIADALRPMLTHELLDILPNVERLLVQSGEGDEALLAKAFHGREQMRERVGNTATHELRDELIHRWRDGVLGLTVGYSLHPEELEHLTHRVNEQVFANDKMDYRLHGVQDLSVEWPASFRWEDTLLDDVDAMVDAHGGQLVLARVPFPPSSADMDEVPAAMEQRLAAWCAETETLCFDLRDGGWTDADFEDARHMTRAGAIRLSRDLGERIVLGPQARRGLAWASPPASSQVPGASAPWRLVAEGDDSMEGVRLWLRGRGEGTLTVQSTQGTREVRFEGDDRAATLSLPVLTPGEELTVSAEGEVTLTHLIAQEGDRQRSLVGRTETLRGASTRILGGRASDGMTAPAYLHPPKVSSPSFVAMGTPRGMGRIDLPQWAGLADASDAGRTRPDQCTPVRVMVGDEPVGDPYASCSDVAALGSGRSCFAGERIFFAPVSGKPTREELASVRLVLDPSRRCPKRSQQGATTLRDSWWLYPKDAVRVDLPLDALSAGLGRIEVEVMPHVREAKKPLRFTLMRGDAELHRVEWRPAGVGRQRRHVLPLPEAVRGDDVWLRIDNGDAGTFQLLTMVAVMEPDPFADREVTTDALEGLSWTVAPESMPFPAAKKSQGGVAGATQLKLFPLWPVSDTVLRKKGFGNWSPLQLNDSQGPLTRVTQAAKWDAGCSRCFAHVGQVALYRGEEEPQLSLVAQRMPDGQIPWVLPGGRLALTPPEGVTSGRLRVRLRALHPAKGRNGEGLSLEAEGTTRRLERYTGAVDAYQGEIPVTSASSVTLHNDDLGTFVLVERVEWLAEGAAYLLYQRPKSRSR